MPRNLRPYGSASLPSPAAEAPATGGAGLPLAKASKRLERASREAARMRREEAAANRRLAEDAARPAAYLAALNEHGDIARAVKAVGFTWEALDRLICTDEAFAERMCEALDRHGVGGAEDDGVDA